MTTVARWLGELGEVPRIEGELLLSEALELSRAQVLAAPERVIDRTTRDRLDRYARRLRQGEPLAYLLGSREFWGHDFLVDSSVLVPRPETELLVEQVLGAAPNGAAVLDLGTGSGAIAISLKLERPDLRITAVDVSDGALTLARENAARLNADVDFVASDWFSALDGRWECIVSNPPYVRSDDPHLDALRFEPMLALTGGNDGLDPIRHITAEAHEHIRPGGALFLEHGWDQGREVAALLTSAGWQDVQTLSDLAGHDRVTRGRFDG